MNGYAGSILHLDLTERKSFVLDTAKYKDWGGGHGFGSALFWDFCKDKTITDGRDPANVVSLATSPFCGTLVPSAGGRCEVTGVGVGQYPFSWYTRSNFGGRFSGMLKYAGWDAVVITGVASKPVWVEIVNRKVTFHDAAALWGKSTQETQEMIWAGRGSTAPTSQAWQNLAEGPDSGRTTQRASILSIGPAGENQTCHGALIHDAGNGAGQGGFGAVWGSKNLKAVCVLGTGSIKVADPTALLQTRFLTQEKYGANADDPDSTAWTTLGGPVQVISFSPPPSEKRRPQACQGCIAACRTRYSSGYGNEASCQETAWYWAFARHVSQDQKKSSEINLRAADVCNHWGFNTYAVMYGLVWLHDLYEEGILGPGRAIESKLPWDTIGTLEFAETLIKALALRQDIGADLADGWVQAAHKWGREEDLHTGKLAFPYWGMPEHGYDPRAELEWGYGSIMTDRDINAHCFNQLYWDVNNAQIYGRPMRIEAEVVVERIAEHLGPYAKGETACLDFGDANMYSASVARLVQWHTHYVRFWKNSALFCDLRWPDFYSTHTEDQRGATASKDAGEHVWWKAVTGEDLSFEDGIRRGRRIYNLDNAIWTLQGRHRDMVHFAPYIYKQKFTKHKAPFYFWPTRDTEGRWAYTDVMGRSLDRERFDDWKTIYYGLEGWDAATGWPTRSILGELGLGFVAEALDSAGRLGKEEDK